jgi:hypothetical protein
MEVIPVDPRTLGDRQGTEAVHHYHVVFWRQAVAPEGRDQHTMLWSAHYNEVFDVSDVHELLTWADEEARKRGAAYTLYAVIELYVPRNEIIGEAVTEFGRRELEVWIGGWDPTKNPSTPNFGRLLPPDAQPIGGTPDEVYGPKRT